MKTVSSLCDVAQISSPFCYFLIRFSHLGPAYGCDRVIVPVSGLKWFLCCSSKLSKLLSKKININSITMTFWKYCFYIHYEVGNFNPGSFILGPYTSKWARQVFDVIKVWVNISNVQQQGERCCHLPANVGRSGKWKMLIRVSPQWFLESNRILAKIFMISQEVWYENEE